MDDSEIEMLDSLESYHWWYQTRKDYLESWSSGMAPRSRILDVGSATGGNTVHLQNLGFEVVSLEFSNIGVDIQLAKGIKVVRSDAREIPFQEGSFDAIICLDVLEHILEDTQVIMEMRRVLKREGKFLISVPEDPKLWSSHDEAVNHFRRYSRGGLLTKVSDTGLNVTRVWSSIILLRPLIQVARFFTSGSNARHTNPVLNRALLIICRIEKWLHISSLPGVTLWVEGSK